MIKPRVKICCISSKDEAALAVRAGASALGLVSYMPSGPGVIDDGLISEIADDTPPGVATFLLTCMQDSSDIIAQQRACAANTIQLCDRTAPETRLALKKALPGIKIVQVVHVEGEESVNEALDSARFSDAILLDSGRPDSKIKELGGTGRRHDWTISARIRSAVKIPLYLAGGINPDNVAQAVRQVEPFGLDLCSGVRTNGRLDEIKLIAFFKNLNSMREFQND